MSNQPRFLALCVFALTVFGWSSAFADDTAASIGNGSDHAAEPVAQAKTDEPKVEPAKAEPAQPSNDEVDADQDERPTDPFDADGDGVVSPEELENRKELEAIGADIPDDVDLEALAKRPQDSELRPSLTPEQFRRLVAVARKIVLQKMAAKIARKADRRMRLFSILVFAFSTLGLALLATPLVLRKKYPGQGRVIFKYSALAAVTFFVTVNLFGGVLYGLRTVQGALSGFTNPSVAIATGTFDTLDSNAEDYVTTGKELFGPTLEQMRNHPDEQPSVLLLENGQRLVKDAKVFLTIRKAVKSVDFIFAVLPIVLMLVTMVLFVIAIKPTLIAIVKLPAAAAANENGGVGKDVIAASMRRVKAELFATLCTVGVLATMTLISGFVLGKTVQPALEAFLFYFSKSVDYLQFVKDASSTLVFVALFSVIVFLVLNVAVLIVSMTLFLGKCQKIFQQRFSAPGTPLAIHRGFFQWGVASVLFVQLFPLAFVFVAEWLLSNINHRIIGNSLDADQISYGKLMVLGPLVLVVSFVFAFWAARGFKAIKFLFKYKIKKPEAPSGPLAPSV